MNTQVVLQPKSPLPATTALATTAPRGFQHEQSEASRPGTVPPEEPKHTKNSALRTHSSTPTEFSEKLALARHTAQSQFPYDTTLTQQTSQIEPEWRQTLRNFNASWSEAYEKTQRTVQNLRGESRDLVQVQILVNKVGIQTQLFSQVGEAVGSTLRKIQQFGSN